jgi:hypothetical protein
MRSYINQKQKPKRLKDIVIYMFGLRLTDGPAWVT